MLKIASLTFEEVGLSSSLSVDIKIFFEVTTFLPLSLPLEILTMLPLFQ